MIKLIYMGKFILSRWGTKKMVQEIMSSRFEAIFEVFNKSDIAWVIEKHIQKLEKDGERRSFVDIGELDSEAIYDELIDRFLEQAERYRNKRARRGLKSDKI